MNNLNPQKTGRSFLNKWSLLFFLLFMLNMISVPSFAQSKKVEGPVTDSKGVPLLGVTVSFKGGNTATTTGNKGRFSILVLRGPTLTFPSASFLTKEEIVDARTSIDVSLCENSQSLENVVVIGYGTQKKVNLSGAVAQINGKELVNRPVPKRHENVSAKIFTCASGDSLIWYYKPFIFFTGIIA